MMAKKNSSCIKLSLSLVGFMSVMLLSIQSSIQTDAADTAPTIALVGGSIETLTDQGTITGTVLIKDGKIEAVGENIDIPAGSRRIDVTGMTVTPGLIDARSTLWLTAAAVNESASNGSLDVLDGANPFQEDWIEVSRQGITAVYVQPSSSGNVGGRAAILRVAPSRSLDQLTIQKEAAVQASLGVSAKSATSRDRATQYQQVKKVFAAAKKYGESLEKKKATDSKKKKTASDKKSSEKKSETKSETKTKPASTTKKQANTSPASPPTDPVKAFLFSAVKRQIPVRLEAHRQDDVSNAFKLADEFKLRLVLDGVSNPHSSLATIASRRTPLVLGPVLELGSSVPNYRKDRDDKWLPGLIDSGNKWAIGTFSKEPRGSRLLRVHAASVVSQGVKKEQVLKAITSDAASILGVGKRVGSIAKGMDADIAVFAGSPLDPSVPVRLTISAGEIVYESEVRKPVVEIEHSTTDGLPASLPKRYAIKTTQFLLDDGSFAPRVMTVADGMVSSVGEDLEPPKGYQLYDLGSSVVTPGLVVAHSDLGLSNDVDETAEAHAGFIRAVDVFDPENSSLKQYLKAGFLTVAYAPGSQNVASGQVGCIRVGSREPVHCGDLGSKFVVTASSRKAGRFPTSLAGQTHLIEQSLSGTVPEIRFFVPKPVQAQLQAERKKFISNLLTQKQTAMIEATSDEEIATALDIIERFKIRACLIGAREFRPYVEDMLRLNVGLIATPARESDYDRYCEDIAHASQSGIKIGFGSGAAARIRLSVALAVNAGMSRFAGLRALTRGAADVTGMSDEIARLGEGSHADFVVWTGSPLILSSTPINIIVDGKLATDE